MKKGMLIYKARGYIYTHFGLIILFFYLLFRDLKSEPVWIIPGAILIIIGEAIRLWSASHIGTCGKKFNLDVEELSTSGPYAFVRNPIYLGNFIWSLGFVVLTKLWYLLPYFYGWLVIMYIFIIPDEEKYLLGKFGDRYEEYRRKVNRLFPKLNLFADREKGVYDIKKGLMNELHVLIYHVVTITVISLFSFFRN